MNQKPDRGLMNLVASDNVATLQMTSKADVAANLAEVERQLDAISGSNVKLIVLPENFGFMGLQLQDILTVAEDFGDGIIQSFISTLAQKYKLWIVAGTIPIKSHEPSRCFSSCLVFNDKGETVARYDKIHLFDVRVSDTEAHQESSAIRPGSTIKTVDTPVGRIGLSICYDLRFPELYRQLQHQGADIFIVPAAFTFDTGKVHWQTLLAARAIENLTYLIASNQCGLHDSGRTTYGHSMIISPWGECLAACDAHENKIVSANVDLEKMKTIRQRFPCLSHQRLK